MDDLDKLLEIMSSLRNPESGCPWDLKQDFKSIIPHTLEEAYEVADSIEKNDLEGLKHELGDLLFQVVFLAQLASEQGIFSFHDVVLSISDKLIRRHPHVFADDDQALASPDEVKAQWEAIKATEREQNDKGSQTSQIADIPANMPALQKAYKLGERAARVGFDWPSAGGVRDKIAEELAELDQELKPGLPDQERIKAECGDVLFSIVQYLRHLQVQPEAALRSCNQRFSDRFAAMEARMADKQQAPESLSAEEWQTLWVAAKEITTKPSI